MGDYATLLKIITDYFREYKAYDLPNVCKKYGIECDGNLDPNASKRIYLESGLKKKTFSDLSMVAKQVIAEGCSSDFTKSVEPFLNGREIPRNPYALRLLAEHTPVDIFLVMLGTNDLLQGASAKEAAARMEAFLNQLLPHCKRFMLVTPPPMKRGAWVPTDELVTESVRLAEEYKILAEKLNIPFVDTRHWNIELTFDGVHFTEEGHHTFANHLMEVIP